MIVNSIFLSGWEYNRVLAPDATTPVVSGLPAQCLWEGAAQFWLFENVYCTTEALAGDFAGYEELGMTSGWIYQDLVKRDFLKPIDLKFVASRNHDVAQELKASHQELRQKYDRDQILDFLVRGRDEELDYIKANLLGPVLRHLKCIKNVSPNCIKHWISSPKAARKKNSATSGLDQLVDRTESASMSYRAGIELCRRPGSGLSPDILRMQRDVENKVQKPLIPLLLLGELSQSDYHNEVKKSSGQVYDPISEQLKTDYKKRIGNLESLRDLAAKYVWPQLHNEWLPRLQDEPSFLPKFERVLRDSLLQAKLDPFLRIFTNIGIAVTGISVGAVTTPSVGGGIAVALNELHTQRRDETKNLALFYQKASER